MRALVLCLLLCFAVSSQALTPKERQIVLAAKEQLEIAKKQFTEAHINAAIAEERAKEADAHAALTDSHAATLQAEVDAAYEREKTNAGLVQKYKGFWDSGHKWFGLGAIGLGIGLLMKHFLIGLAILVVLGIVVVVFVPWLIPMFKTAIGVITSIFRRKP